MRMKVSTAVLPFLILAAVLGSQAQVIYDVKIRELQRTVDLHELPVVQHVLANAPDCCFSYTSRRIRCKLMEGYFETSSGCSQPGVIFVTKKGQQVCADPGNPSVQDCITNLKTIPRNRKLA